MVSRRFHLPDCHRRWRTPTDINSGWDLGVPLYGGGYPSANEPPIEFWVSNIMSIGRLPPYAECSRFIVDHPKNCSLPIPISKQGSFNLMMRFVSTEWSHSGHTDNKLKTIYPLLIFIILCHTGMVSGKGKPEAIPRSARAPALSYQLYLFFIYLILLLILLQFLYF